MSYCRWSNDDFQCDVYAWEDCGGGWRTEVAGNRPVYKTPLPPPDDGTPEGWVARHRIVMQMVDEAERVKIGLEHDGASFHDDTLTDFRDRLLMLRHAGYRIPDYVFERITGEMDEETAP